MFAKGGAGVWLPGSQHCERVRPHTWCTEGHCDVIDGAVAVADGVLPVTHSIIHLAVAGCCCCSIPAATALRCLDVFVAIVSLAVTLAVALALRTLLAATATAFGAWQHGARCRLLGT